MYGVSKDGFPVMIMADDFHPYFYTEAPDGFTPSDCASWQTRLSRVGVRDISLVSKRAGNPGAGARPFLKVTLEKASQMAEARNALAAESQARGACHAHLSLPTYGCAVPFLSKFMADKKISPMNWLRVLAGQYQLTESKDKVSAFGVEVRASAEDLKLLTETEKQNLGLPANAPLRVLSFDIETMVPANNSFPKPASESVIQISSVVARRSYSTVTTDTEDPFFRCVFTLDSCADVPGCTIFSFETEEDLLRAWKTFMVDMDPDLVMGHNILRFDLPYLLLRAKALNLRDFDKLGRLTGVATPFDHPFQGPNQDGWVIAPFIAGRITVDLMHWAIANIQNPQKGDMKLDTLAHRFLGEGKDSVHFSEIRKLQMGTAETRMRLAKYCLKDADLVLKLVDHRRCVQDYYIPRVKRLLLTLNSAVSTVNLSQLSELGRLKEADGKYLIRDVQRMSMGSLTYGARSIY